MQTGTELSRGRTNLALATLLLGMFVLGSGELLVVVAIGAFDASSTVMTGLVIAVIAILAAWATSLLKPPAIIHATGGQA